MVSLITKFSHDPTVSMIFVQVALVNLQVFGGGVFLAWNDCPEYVLAILLMNVVVLITSIYHVLAGGFGFRRCVSSLKAVER